MRKNRKYLTACDNDEAKVYGVYCGDTAMTKEEADMVMEVAGDGEIIYELVPVKLEGK